MGRRFVVLFIRNGLKTPCLHKYFPLMRNTTVPVSLPDDLLEAVRETASATGLSQAEVIRQSTELGLNQLRAGRVTDYSVRRLTREESASVYGPDEYWDPLEEALAKNPRPVSREDD